MSGPPNEESALLRGEERVPQPAGIVERLVRDDVDRKRFLKMAGGAGAASFSAFVLAACGSSTKTTSTAATSASAAHHRVREAPATWRSSTTRSRSSTWRRSSTKRSIASGLFSGKVGSLIKELRRPGGDARGSAERRVEKLGGTPAANPDGKFPIDQRHAGRRAGVHRREPRRGRLSRPGGQHPEPRSARDGARDPLGRGAPRGDARHAGQEVVTPDGAFAKPADMSTVLAAVKPFLA